MTSTRTTPFSVGADGVAAWSALHAGAWIGLLETHKQLTRALEAELDGKFALTLSELELLGRAGGPPLLRAGAVPWVAVAGGGVWPQPQPRVATRRGGRAPRSDRAPSLRGRW